MYSRSQWIISRWSNIESDSWNDQILFEVSQTPSTISLSFHGLKNYLKFENRPQSRSKVPSVRVITQKFRFLNGQQCKLTDCMYLHEVAEEEASFTKDDMSKARFTVNIPLLSTNPFFGEARESWTMVKPKKAKAFGI